MVPAEIARCPRNPPTGRAGDVATVAEALGPYLDVSRRPRRTSARGQRARREGLGWGCEKRRLGNRTGRDRSPMLCTRSARIQDYFADLTDPRRREVTYPLINVVVIAICAVICGADDFVAIADFGKARRDWLARFLDLSNGIPSHDRFNAIFAALKPAEFEACLLGWITALHEITDGQVIAIDGKTLRRSFDTASSKAAIHMVSAWATANHISLGQVVVDEKSNEITAIPKLLEMLELSGALVTIDAMGCQTEIAEKIVKAGADYCLAVKANQPTLHQGIVDFFADHLEDDFARARARHHETHEQGHGREERRFYTICQVPEDLPDGSRWAGLKAIGVSITDAMRGRAVSFSAWC